MTIIQNKRLQFQITGNWGMLAKALKNKFNNLTDADLKFVPGRENDLLERVGISINKRPEEVMHLLRDLMPKREFITLSRI